MSPLELRVVYPRPSGSKMVLRTEQDWNKDVQPSSTSADGTVTTFQINATRPYLYFKPCLITQDGQLHWSVGSNYLALNTPPKAGRDLYPHFFGSMNGDHPEAGGPRGGRRAPLPRLPPARLQREHAQEVPGALHARRGEPLLPGRGVRGGGLGGERHPRDAGHDEPDRPDHRGGGL